MGNATNLGAAIVLSLIASGGWAESTGGSTTVIIADGTVGGAVAGDITSFKGIPFAAPPVGPLRWRAPQPVARWAGVKSATEFGPSCIQAKNDLDGGNVHSEDCLTINVWTRSRRAKRPLPVMVWIYGGGFVVGSSASPFYDGTSFVRKGVVLVSFNYRLGRLGFFAHPALDVIAGGEPIGNYGMMDQIAALKWVQKNIAAFGGDPGNVTIFGESAGAVSVNTLMTTPAAAGLFAKAIAESGFGRTDPPSLAKAEAAGSTFAMSRQITGSGANTAAALRALPADVVLGSSSSLLDPNTPKPMIDGRIIRERIDAAFANGHQAKIPYLLGGNSLEASLFAEFVSAHPEVVLARSGIPQARAVELFGDGDLQRAAFNLATISLMTEPDRFLARTAVKSGMPVYNYYFSYVPLASRSAEAGAVHGAEVPYVFGALPAAPTRIRGRTIPAATAYDRAISDAMQTYWTNFAKTGAPGSTGSIRWPPYSPTRDTILEFGNAGIAVRPPLFPKQLDTVEKAALAATAP